MLPIRMKLIAVACVLGVGCAGELPFDVEGPVLTSAAGAAIDGRAVLNIVAHEDDDLLFLNPDIASDIQAGIRERTVFVTAGDANMGQAYWQGREAGILAAYSTMAGVANAWTAVDAGIAGYPLQVRTLVERPTVSLIFMHLPDGFGDGAGSSANAYESLQKLWQGAIARIHTVDGISAYTRAELIATLQALVAAFQPQTIRTQDYLGSYGDGDHSDHHSVGYLVRQAHTAYTADHVLVAYQDYAIKSRPANLAGAEYAAKADAWNAYVQHDVLPCGSPPNCGSNDYAMWLSRRYTLGSETGGSTPGSPNLALGGRATASSTETDGFEAARSSDGDVSTRWSSGYEDNQWWQVDLGSVQEVNTVVVSWEAAYASAYEVQTSTDGLTFRTAAAVTATSAGVDRITFASSPARHVRIQCLTRATEWGFSFWEAAVYGPDASGANTAPVARAGPAQSVAPRAVVTLDGSGSFDADGDPLLHRWTQTGGPAVTLSGATAQRPTFTAPGTAATLSFSLIVNDGVADSAAASVQVTVTPVNLALGGRATASSTETSGFEAARANDGSGGTRWSSSYANNQWWQVDLGSARSVDTLVVSWEAAYAAAYEVQTSTDGLTFRTAAAVTATSAQTQRATFTPRTARYVRILCRTRATGYGFSFWEAAVYGPS